ncbi:MAG: O-antigen ligase family protein, partial [Candidatus Hodarchaeota archaeon]
LIVLLILSGYMLEKLMNYERIPFRELMLNTQTILIVGLQIFIVLSWMKNLETYGQSLYTNDSLYLLSQGLKPFLVYCLFLFFIKDEKSLQKIFWVIVLGGATSSILCIFRYIGSGGTARGMGFSLDPNYFGLYLTLPFLLSLNFMISEEIWSKKLSAAFCFLIISTAILLTLSRATWIGVFIAFFIFLSKHQKRTRLLAIVSIIFIVLVVANFHVIYSRVFEAFNPQSTFYERLKLSRIAIMMFRDHWLWGVGFGNFINHVGKYLGAVDLPQYDIHIAHNSYLSFFAETGIFGGILFLIISLLAWLNCYRALKLSIRVNSLALFNLALPLEAALIGTLIIMASITAGDEYFFWMMVSLSCATLKLSRQSIGKEDVILVK